MKSVLFVSWYNSARSQMAEGLLRKMGGESFEVYSAGIEKALLKEEAVTVMNEIGIDISGQESKTLDKFLNEHFDLVITVCDSANEACPNFPNAKKRIHWSFPDPFKASGTETEILLAYRQARDTIEERIKEDLL